MAFEKGMHRFPLNIFEFVGMDCCDGFADHIPIAVKGSVAELLCVLEEVGDPSDDTFVPINDDYLYGLAVVIFVGFPDVL